MKCLSKTEQLDLLRQLAKDNGIHLQDSIEGAMSVVTRAQKRRIILVLSDYATRYPEAIPLRNITAKKVTEVLIEIFARHGIPGEILTDQGTNFTSSLLGELYKLIGVTALRTSPYHPQTDGLVERLNRTL